MRDFIDLEGASGAKYRFRLWPAGESHAPMAGNYAVVREDRGKTKIVALGQSLDLSGCRAEALRGRGPGVQVFTRLNVARAARETEHDDLSAALRSDRRREKAD
jgi:hypothetical protein